MPNPPATQMRTFHLEAPLARVFPLFTADGERVWAPGWEPRSEAGESFVAQFLSDEHYTRMIEEWQAATRKALRLAATP
jgi:hypothetical protein